MTRLEDCTCGVAWGTADGPCVCEPRPEPEPWPRAPRPAGLPEPVGYRLLGYRTPEPGELCTCGLQALVVYVTEAWGDVPSCK